MLNPKTLAADPQSLERCRALLGRHFLLRDAGRETIDRLVAMASILTVPAGTELFAKGDRGDSLYGVLTGRMRIYVSSPEGADVVLNLLGPEELFGEIALIDDEPRSASAAAVENTRLMRIRRDRFLPFLRENAEVGVGLLQVLCRRIRAISERTEDQVFLPLPARLAKRVVALSRDDDEDVPRGAVHEVRMSQRDLGNLVGATRESVNRVLTGWRAQGLVTTDGGRIVVLKPRALEALGRFD